MTKRPSDIHANTPDLKALKRKLMSNIEIEFNAFDLEGPLSDQLENQAQVLKTAELGDVDYATDLLIRD